MSLDPRERRIREEIDHHLAELEAQLRAEGMDEDEARVEARRRFGDSERVRRDTRSVSAAEPPGWRRAFDVLRQDVAYALRQLARQPLVSGLTLATIVVGVAATVVVFSVVHAVVLRPLPFQEPDGLVHVSQTSPQGREYSVSEPNFVDFRARQRSFDEMAAMGFGMVILSNGGESVAVEAMRVSHSLFPMVGIEPVLGRGFSADEDILGGATDVALLSEGAWERRFGRQPDLVGRSVLVDGTARVIVGVVPSDRAWPGVEVFTPLAPDPVQFRDDQRLESIARLLPGTTIAEAQADLSRIAADLSVEYPQSNDGWGALVKSARDWRIGPRLTRLGGLLLGAVGLFLLMACASASNLMLARATSRLGEMSVRAALGAGRKRIVAQLVTEGALLGVVGGGMAVAVAVWTLRIVRALGPSDIGRLGEASVDGAVLFVAAASAVFTVLVASLAPGLLIVRGGAFRALRSGTRAGSGSGRGFRDVLTMTQFALAVTVLLSAGLLTRSFVAMQEVDLGYEPGGVVRFAVRLSDDAYDQLRREDYALRLKSELEALPGVVAVGVTTASPYHRFRPSNFVARSDREPDRQEDFVPVSWRAIAGDYFEAAGIELLAGRTFGPEEQGQRGLDVQNPAVIIDETLAAELWPEGENPVGRLVTWFLPGGRQCVVVGVVAAARDERLDQLPRPRIYRPFTYTGWPEPNVLVRTDGDAAALVPAIRQVVLTLDPSVPPISPSLLTEDMRESVAWPRFSMQVLGVFGAIALLLAAMGIYGVTAFSVARRGGEIGLRVALGAEPSGVHWMVLRAALRLALVGIGVGVIASLAATGLLQSLLYEVSATDPITFVLVPTVLLAVAAAAAWVPARRALRTDPRSALTAE